MKQPSLDHNPLKAQITDWSCSLSTNQHLALKQLLDMCFCEGDETLWAKFFSRIQPVIAGVVIKSLRRWRTPFPVIVDDLVQETHLKLCANDFKALREFTCEHDNALYGFLKVVASHVVQDHCRSFCSLGYLRLGQPATELSGGEAQRIKLATELQRAGRGKTLYILDEPTTGLHASDIEKLMTQLNGLVEAGNTVIVIEHDMRVAAGSDWIIDIGPGAGDEGGRILGAGTPQNISNLADSKTAPFSGNILGRTGFMMIRSRSFD